VAVETKVRLRFQELTSQWKTQSRYLSNTAQMAMLWPYQQIIGLGAIAVPLILAELRRETDHWFWALEAITGENPVFEGSRRRRRSSGRSLVALGTGERAGWLKRFLFRAFPCPRFLCLFVSELRQRDYASHCEPIPAIR